jgi:hypothetical protein
MDLRFIPYKFIATFLILIMSEFAFEAPLSASVKATVEPYLDNAIFDAFNRETGEMIYLKRDSHNILQLYKLDVSSSDPVAESVCLSCEGNHAVGIDRELLSKMNKGACDWHPSGEWFVTEMEIPDNPAIKYSRKFPGVRRLAEPGAGWWNNLYLVKKDGSVWVQLTSFKPSDINSGVLYPRFSKDGRMLAWAEKTGGAKPFNRYPFARWKMKTARIDIDSQFPRLYNIKTFPVNDSTIFEPQEFTQDGRLIYAADTGYSNLDCGAYRLDVWQARIDKGGNACEFKNLTSTPGFYEEQTSISPDGKYMAIMTNLFDNDYEERLDRVASKTKYHSFITTNLSTELYLVDSSTGEKVRLTYFTENDRNGFHPIVTRSAWTSDGKTIFIAVAFRSNVTGEKETETIYRIRLENP